MTVSNIALRVRLKAYFTNLMLLFVCFGYAQKFPENRITLNFTNDSLHHVLRAIGDTQPDRYLNFSNVRNDKNRLVTAQLDDVTLVEALERVLADQPIYKDFQIIEYNTFRVVKIAQHLHTGSKYFDKDRKVDTFYRVGDELPNIPFPIENYHRPNILLHDFKGKLLILDMWGVNCSGCIAAFPKMEALQEKFGDKIQIILATKDSKVMVDDLKTRSANVRETTLPIVTGENPLAYLFDYRGVPIHYWIDENGVLKYVTRHTSEELIADYLAGKDLNLTEKRDTSIYVGNDRPIGVGLNSLHGANFGVSSYLAPYDDSVYEYSSTIGHSYTPNDPSRDSAEVKKFKSSAVSLYKLYKYIYGKTEGPRTSEEVYFPNSWVIIEAEDPAKYIPVYGVQKKNLYDFELIVKNKQLTMQQFGELMRHQLDAYFGLESSLEERDVNCFVIKKSGDKLGLLAKNNDSSYDVEDGQLSVRNVMWWKVITSINMPYRRDLPQLVDETGLDPETSVDIDMSLAFDTDLDKVNKSLAPYGLVVENTTRKKDVIVLKERR